MSAKENKALVRRFLKAHEGEADLDALDKMLAPDFVSHGKRLPDQQPGREGYKQAIAQYTDALSNHRVLVEEQVAEGDKVVTRFTIHVTHDRRELLGVAPTDRDVAFKAMSIYRISGGQDRRGVGLGIECPTDDGAASRAREDRARAHRAGAASGTAHPASLAPQGGAHLGRLADQPLLPAS
jgi:predicted ester cyclase